MKKQLFLIVATLIVLASCQNNKNLTDEEIQKIETEVKDEFEKLKSATSQLDFDSWADFFSKDAFVSHIYSCRGYNMNFTTWANEVKSSFDDRNKHQTEHIELKVTPLGRNHALVTNEAIWENWWKNGTYTKKHGFSSYVWKKENNRWKIIHVNNGGVVLESNDPDYK